MYQSIIRWLLALAATASFAVAVDKGVIAADRWQASSHFPVWYVLGILAATWLGAVLAHLRERRIRPKRGLNGFTLVEQAYVFVTVFGVSVGELFGVIARLASR